FPAHARARARRQQAGPVSRGHCCKGRAPSARQAQRPVGGAGPLRGRPRRVGVGLRAAGRPLPGPGGGPRRADRGGPLGGCGARAPTPRVRAAPRAGAAAGAAPVTLLALRAALPAPGAAAKRGEICLGG
ncbi:unnamed protein product, partial [Prorocentrum cordatum]